MFLNSVQLHAGQFSNGFVWELFHERKAQELRTSLGGNRVLTCLFRSQGSCKELLDDLYAALAFDVAEVGCVVAWGLGVAARAIANALLIHLGVVGLFWLTGLPATIITLGCLDIYLPFLRGFATANIGYISGAWPYSACW